MTTQIPTPYFVIDEPTLQRYYDMLADSLAQNWPNYLIGYSFKTNSLPWLVSFVKRNGSYAEVVSEDEYLLAKYLGFSDHEIIYNGPYKSRKSFENVLLAGGYVNLDSRQELEWLTALAGSMPDRTFKVGIRANFELEKCVPAKLPWGRPADGSVSVMRQAGLRMRLRPSADSPMYRLQDCIFTPAAKPAVSVSSARLPGWPAICKKNSALH